MTDNVVSPTVPDRAPGDVSAVRLRPATSDDASVLRRLRHEEGSAPYNWYGYRGDPQFERRLAETGLLEADGSGALLVVAGDAVLGVTAWKRIVHAPTSHCWSLGMTLLPEHRGHGLGTAATRLIVRYLFSHTLVERIEADTAVDNAAAQHVLLRAGFSREGVLRHAQYRAGRWHDIVLFSVLRHEVALG